MSSDRMKWLQENPAICPAPFVGLALRSHYDNSRTDIRYSCCCNLNTNAVPPGGQREFFDALRNKIKHGQKHYACNLCYRLEEKGIVSERMRYWLSQPDDYIKTFLDTWSSDTFEIQVKFSNLCPIACRSCHSNESSTYSKITKDPSVTRNVEIDFTGIKKNLEEVQETIHDISSRFKIPALHLIGGEPLVQAGAVDLMQWVIEQGLANKFELRLTTGWSVNLNDKFLDCIKHFRSVYFLLSIDSVGKNYQYVRWPVSFNKVENNLERLLDIMPMLQESCIHLSPVFSLNNIFYIVDYMDYFYAWMQKNRLSIPISNLHLHQPEYLQNEILPEPYRSDLRLLLEKCLDHPLITDSYQANLKAFLENTIDQLKNKSGDEKRFEEYLRHTAEFDVRTQTKMEDFNDRLYDQLLPQHLNIYHNHFPLVDKDKYIKISISKATNAHSS